MDDLTDDDLFVDLVESVTVDVVEGVGNGPKAQQSKQAQQGGEIEDAASATTGLGADRKHGDRRLGLRGQRAGNTGYPVTERSRG